MSKVFAAILAIFFLAIPICTYGEAPLTITSIIVTPEELIGWESPFTMDALVTGGIGPYTYSWKQIRGAPAKVSGTTTQQLVGISPARTDLLTPRDRDRWQALGVGRDETVLEFHLQVADSDSGTTSATAEVTIIPIGTSGLGFVGLGTETLINGVDQNDYDWSLITRPPGSSSFLLPSDNQATRFLPDVQGSYVANDSVSGEEVTIGAYTWKGVGTVDGGTANATQCGLCHAALEGFWDDTLHANVFEDNYASFGGDPKHPSMPRMTVGFDTSGFAVNDGYDDNVNDYMTLETFDCGHDGLCPGDPSYVGPDADGTEGDGFPDLPAMFTDLPDEVKQTTGVQCESCHGPFVPLHWDGNTATPAGHISWEPQVCGRCHEQETEWLRSGHASALPRSDPECVACHDGNYFVDILFDGFPAPDVAVDDGENIVCAACHDPHEDIDHDGNPATYEHTLRFWGSVTLPNGTVSDGVGPGAVCMMCHSGRSTTGEMVDEIINGSEHFGPHYGVQGYMMAGVMGYEYVRESYSDSFHATGIEKQCTTCHMAPTVDVQTDPAYRYTGGHTLAMAVLGDGEELHSNVANSCNQAGCHSSLDSFDPPAESDIDGDGLAEGTQTEVQGLLDKLGNRLPPYNQPTVTTVLNDGNSTPTQRQAAWNWHFVSRDGSRGIHNLDYTVQLLQTAIANTPEAPDRIFADGFED